MKPEEENKIQPKVFISYSWTSPSHQLMIIHYAEQLVSSGVEVVLDVYDLKEGQDKYAFMERMVTDETMTHVLIFCDKVYSEKADSRKAGVGTESQIILEEVYEKVEQSKFIPIVCEISEEGKPYLPAFLKSRKYIDFSSPEKANENWEKLIRTLFGKPLYEKPKIGNPPAYITDDIRTPSSPAITKFIAFQQALLQEKKGISIYRRDFLDACFNYADELRTRERPKVSDMGTKIMEDCGKLKIIRNHIVDWVLLESEVAPTEKFCEELILFLEKMRELKSRPEEVTSWEESWFEAHALFVYETFLYIITALLKTRNYKILHEIFTTHYLVPYPDRRSTNKYVNFDCFYTYSNTLQSVLASEGRRLHSPAAELIRRQSDRIDLTFTSLMEAELLIFLMALINPNLRWYPQTLLYATYNFEFLFFIRATQHKHFLDLVTVTGISDVNILREEVKKGFERNSVSSWGDFVFGNSFWNSMNMDNLDSVK